MELWEKEFGNVAEAKDFAGRTIHKCAFGQNNSQYGWDVDHIQPLSKNGKDIHENKQIVHVITNDEKGNKTTFVSANGNIYQVKKTSQVESKYWANHYKYSQKKYCMVKLEK